MWVESSSELSFNVAIFMIRVYHYDAQGHGITFGFYYRLAKIRLC